MFLNNKILGSVVLSSLLITGLYADEAPVNNELTNANTEIVVTEAEKLQLQIDMIERYGSIIETPLFFKNYPFLEIELAKSFFNLKKNQAELLLTVKNNESFPFNFSKLLNLGKVQSEIIKGGGETKIVVSENSFETYLTDVSNKKFKKDEARMNSLKTALQQLLIKMETLEEQYVTLKNMSAILEIEKSQIVNENTRLGDILVDIINKFPVNTRMLAVQTMTGDNQADINSLDLNIKTGVLRILINEQAENLANYMLEIEVSDILNELELVKTRSTILEKQIVETQPYIDSLKSLVMDADADVTNIDVLKEGVVKITSINMQLDEKDKIIAELKAEIVSLKDDASTLKRENKKLNNLLNNVTLQNSMEKMVKCENENREIDNKYQDIVKMNNMLKIKNATIMKENRNLFKKYDDLATTVEKLMSEKTVLKLKIKKLQSLL